MTCTFAELSTPLSVYGTQLNNENKNRALQKPGAGWLMPQEEAETAIPGEGWEFTLSLPLPPRCSGLKIFFSLYIGHLLLIFKLKFIHTHTQLEK